MNQNEEVNATLLTMQMMYCTTEKSIPARQATGGMYWSWHKESDKPSN